MAVSASTSFKRPQFSPLPPSRQARAGVDRDGITSLPALIRFNAVNNPNRIFSYQVESNRREQEGATNGHSPYTARPVTFSELGKAVAACSSWIREKLQDNNAERPVALYLESDLGLFIHLAALMSINTPALLLSARLGAPSIRHLLEKTNASTLLVSKRTRATVADWEDGAASVELVEPYTSFLRASDGDSKGLDIQVPDVKEDSCNAMILHSSGTTGLPKPIPVAHRYLLGYAACHQFGANEKIDWVNLSTLPLYHGFGILAPSLSLSVGLTCCFPPSSIIPAAHSTVDLIRTTGAKSLMTVPSILQDILSLADAERTSALGVLSELKFAAVGGGALNPEAGAQLVKGGVKVLNHYGVTEIGAIAPIFCPGPDYNWRYLRLRTDLGLELRPVPDSKSFRLVGYPCGWDHEFEIQDEMERNPDCKSRDQLEVRVLGRVDDLIVLKTGEKVMPQPLEERLTADEAVRTAVCVGSGRFEMAVLVEPSNNAPEDPQELQDRVWNITSESNKSLDQHARVSSKKAIIIKPADKDIPRTDKGSVMRRELVGRFQEEIDAAYAAIESDVAGSEGIELDLDDVESSIRRILDAVAGAGFKAETLPREDDFFEHGLDSLQSLRLARYITPALRRQRAEEEASQLPQLTAEFVYRHPNIKLLAEAVKHLVANEVGNSDALAADRLATMKSTADEYIAKVKGLLSSPAHEPESGTIFNLPAFPPAPSSAQHVILLTGSTGSLGAHVLATLARTRSVAKIVCLIRGSRACASVANVAKNNSNSNGANGNGNGNTKVHTKLTALADYQRSALRSAGISDTSLNWRKIQLVDADRFSPSSLSDDDIGGGNSSPLPEDDLARQITHVVHLAWPMDFQRTLASFRPHLDSLRGLLALARRAGMAKPDAPGRRGVRVVFASSIAAVRHYHGVGSEEEDGGQKGVGVTVPEEPLTDPSVALPMGYAEGKWVCERMMVEAARVEAGAGADSTVEPVVVRIGQLSGPEHLEGAWKTAEHMPVLVRACQRTGVWPDLEGTASWLPVDNAAQCLGEMVLSPDSLPPVLHLENPVRQPMRELITVMARELGVTPGQVAGTLVPFDEWLGRTVDAGNLPASLADFFREHFRVLGQGKIVLDTSKSRKASKSLRRQGGVGKEVVAEYVRRWKKEGFLK